MKNLFNTILSKKPKKNVFDLTHDVKFTANMGNLVPMCLMEAVPGDKFNLSNDTLVRMAPMIAPVMHRMDVSVHYFFVPNRILWDDWENFITNNADLQVPYIEVNDSLADNEKKFLDYLGVPPCPTGGTPEQVNALPMAAYQCVYNEYYRDENLISEVTYQLQNGDNSTNPDLKQLRNRAWEHDYFTAALPFAQKGAAVDIPLGDVELKDDWSQYGSPDFQTDPPGLAPAGTPEQPVNPTTPGIGIGGTGPLAYDPKGTLTVQATTINDLRRAMRLQEWLEKNARGGTRYIESILEHFGVRSSDARLNRPEYITGSKNPLMISEVLNTTGESGGLPQGNMAGHGLSVTKGYEGSYYAEEHGFIIGIMSVLPKTNYQQGINKLFLRKDNLDYYWPSFAHIGEQEIQNRELYAYTNNGDGNFGYIPRYSEYKYMPSRVAGEFRTNLAYWHLGRIFTALPNLAKDFIECQPEDTTRIFAVTSTQDDHLYIETLNKVKAVRPMPVYGTPML